MLATDSAVARGALPPGCAFAPRCGRATDICRRAEPEPQQVDNRLVACHHREAA